MDPAHGASSENCKDLLKDRSTFLGLPLEIRIHIARLLVKKHDLYQLCQVNRSCFELALPELYNDIRLEVEDGPAEDERVKAHDPRLLRIFDPSNPGLRLIRHITVIHDDFYECKMDRYQPFMAFLLDRIPDHQLYSFKLNIREPITWLITARLLSEQHSLRYLEIYPANKISKYNKHQPRKELLLQAFTSWRLNHLQKVKASIDTLGVATIVSKALQSRSVRELEINTVHYNIWLPDKFTASAPLSEKLNTLQDALVNALFEFQKRVPPGMPALYDQLTSLKLTDVKLQNCQCTWFTYLDLSQLKHLSLKYCSDIDTFLDTLRVVSNPALTSLDIIHNCQTSGDLEIQRLDNSISAIENILSSSVLQLRSLTVCLRNASREIIPCCFQDQGRWLQMLYLDMLTYKPSLFPQQTTQNGDIYELNGFCGIIANCPALTQLAFVFPEYTPAYSVFGNEHYWEHHTESFGIWIKHLASSMPQLRSLCILNWRRDARDSGHIRQSRSDYFAGSPQLARLATSIFSVFHEAAAERGDSKGSRLKVVGFGRREEPRVATCCYVEGQAIVHGKSRTVAFPAKLAQLKEQGFDHEIFSTEVIRWEQLERAETDPHVGMEEEWEEWMWGLPQKPRPMLSLDFFHPLEEYYYESN